MSENNTAVAPVAKKRLQAFKAMPPALQEVATEFEGKLGRGAQGVILIHYDMGARLGNIISDEATYGSGAVQQLADYLNIPGGTTTLYNLRNFAEEFDKEYVKQWSGQPMANGHYLEMSHWFQLMKIKEKKDQEKMLARVLKNNMSANDLEKEIRAGSVKTKNARQGGRKPQRPSSAIAGLQKTFGLAQQLNRYEEVAEKDVFDAIEEMSADDVTDALKEKLERTVETLGETEEKSAAMRKRGEECLERIERILEQKAEASEDEGEGEDESPKKAKAKAKASANGHAGKKAKKKAKKARVQEEEAVGAGAED